MTLPKRSEGPPSWARVGAKVVCIDDDGQYISSYLPNSNEFVIRGETYVIRWAGIATDWRGEHAAVHVTGVVRIDPTDGKDVPFAIERFKPLITLEADLEAHFSQLLHVPSTHTVDA